MTQIFSLNSEKLNSTCYKANSNLSLNCQIKFNFLFVWKSVQIHSFLITFSLNSELSHVSECLVNIIFFVAVLTSAVCYYVTSYSNRCTVDTANINYALYTIRFRKRQCWQSLLQIPFSKLVSFERHVNKA